ncbi:MAG TPA: hypothetical protein VM513_00455 [Kofleriaceae bacterium]|nr:hypothetical protein [Kofleriaceae bacterium]
MTAQLRSMIEQAKRLTREERDALVGELLGMDEPQPPALTREELDRQLAASIAQAERGEFVDEAEVLAELNE